MQNLGFLAKYDGKIRFEEIRQLSDDEYSIYLNALKDIYRIDEEIALFHMIYINYFDFYGYVEYILENFHETQYIQTKINLYINNLNCKLNNFLSSIKLFLDHFERKLKDSYGKDSEEVNRFKKETSRLYDNYFSYRFLYHLRNYIQHRNVAISNLNIYEDNVKVELEVSLNRDLLLSDFRWKSEIKNDLINCEEHIGIFPLMGEMLENLKELTKFLIRDELEKIKDSVMHIRKLMDEVERQYLPVIFEYREDKINFSDFPIDLMNFIDYVIN